MHILGASIHGYGGVICDMGGPLGDIEAYCAVESVPDAYGGYLKLSIG